MIDFILNEKMAGYAKEFGFREFVNVKIIDTTILEEFRKSVFKGEIAIVKANNKLLRNIFENKKVNIVLGLEEIEDKDGLHYRNSGLNQILCKLAVKNKINVGFSFYDILNAKNRSKLLGRMMQNAKLCKKYKVNMVFGSFAKDKYDLRMKKDLEALGRLIGIDKFDNANVFKLKEFSDIKVV